jgi:fumarate hydratase class I
MINEGVRRAYNDPENPLRASIVADPLGKRKNTNDNTPAVVHYELVPGNTVDIKIAAKGGGSENKSKFTMLNPVGLRRRLGPQDGADDGCRLVPAGHAGYRRRRHGGEGDAARQGIADGAHRHARARRARARQSVEELRLELYEKVNALGIGAQGLGGLSTVLDVKILDYPRTRRRSRSPSFPIARRRATRTSRSTARACAGSTGPTFRCGRTCTGRRRRPRSA